MKSSPQIAPPTARKALASGVANPGQFRHRHQKRQTVAQILAHIAVLRQHDPLAPIAGICQAIVRAAAVHPLLAVAGVMMRQRKMWTAVAKPSRTAMPRHRARQ